MDWLKFDKVVSAPEFACACDLLAGTDPVVSGRAYDRTVVDEIRGVERDPLSTEIEVRRREEIKRIEWSSWKKIADLLASNAVTPSYSDGREWSEVSASLAVAEKKKNLAERIEKIMFEQDSKIRTLNDELNLI